MQEQEYVGFWARTGASIIDSILLVMVIWPLLIGIYGWKYLDKTELILGPADFFISWLLPVVLVICFWVYKQATPGKMLVSAKIVDAKTGGVPSTGQLVGRYFAYLVSYLSLGLGFLWVAFDKRKQGWHDKLAGTVVVPDRITSNTVRIDQF